MVLGTRERIVHGTRIKGCAEADRGAGHSCTQAESKDSQDVPAVQCILQHLQLVFPSTVFSGRSWITERTIDAKDFTHGYKLQIPTVGMGCPSKIPERPCALAESCRNQRYSFQHLILPFPPDYLHIPTAVH